MTRAPALATLLRDVPARASRRRDERAPTLNQYDEFEPDVPALLADQERHLPPPCPSVHSGEGLGLLPRAASWARLYTLGFLVKTGLRRRLVYANLALDWFHEFQAYWCGELGNRPIHPHDFHFLTGVYRQRCQAIHFPEVVDPRLATDEKHLAAWRDPRMVYNLFAYAYRHALSPLRVHPYVRFIPRGGRVAEYGCGAAPLLSALARHYRHLDLRLVGADIPHLLFHYARWKLADRPFVTMVPIQPGDDGALPGRYDTVFCLEVFEHLQRPLAALRHFHDVLEPGGHLIFDYIRSDATGLDTGSALRDRIPALEFVREHFDVVQGQVPTDGSHVGPSVARKRRESVQRSPGSRPIVSTD